MTKRTPDRVLWIALAALAMAVALSCGSDETTYETADGEMTVSQEGETTRFRMKDGQVEGTFGAEATLPDDFPEDAPVPDGLALQGVVSSNEGGEQVTLITYESDDSPEALVAAFKASVADRGWSLDEEMSMMGQNMLQVSKGDRRLMIQVMDRAGTTVAMLHMGIQ